MTFTVLTVCSANVCRSPLMSVSLERSVFAQSFGGDVVVRSAGVTATAGEPACQEIARLATVERHVVQGARAASIHPADR